MGLDSTTHRFSIIVIKDTYNEFSNRYLLHYVPSWNCDLFFSFRTLDVGNEDNIKTQLSNLLNINRDSISLEYKSNELQTKYSQNDKVTKIYDHSYYLATISSFPDDIQADEFTIGDEKCKWMSYNSMMENSRIREVNSDVVQYVRDYVA